VRSPDGKEGFNQNSRVAENTGVGPFRRLLLAFVGLLAGNAALLLFDIQNAVRVRAALLTAHIGAPAAVFPQMWELYFLYAIFSLAGWTLVGLPIALAFPARLLTRLIWPIRLLIGAALGPLALLLIFVLLAGRLGQFSTLSLAQTESLWPFSILVSTVSFVVYAALLRRRVQG
jgi:hypothetical protein